MKRYEIVLYFDPPNAQMVESPDGEWVNQQELNEILNEVIATAISILNSTDNKIIEDEAAWIADQLIALTNPPSV